MQLKYYLLVLLFAITRVTSAQDVIHRMDSTTINASVKSITPRIITYKRADNPDGPDYTISVNNVDHIAFANGTEASFNELHPKGIRQPHHVQRMREARKRMPHKRTPHPPLDEIAQLRITPSSLLDPWGAMVPLSVEINFGKHFGFEAMAAIPLNSYFAANIFSTQQLGVHRDSKYTACVLYYPGVWKNTRIFIGLEAFYRAQVLTNLGSGTLYEGNIDFYTGKYLHYTNADLTKNYRGGCFRIGVATRIAGHFWFDCYTGLGLLDGWSHHTNLRGTTNSLGSSTTSSAEDFTSPIGHTNQVEGRNTALFIPLAIRLSYHINCTKKQ